MANPLKITFDNRFFQQLPFSYEEVEITPLQQSFMVAHSESAAKLINLPTQYWQYPEFLEIFSGNSLPTNSHSIAQVYAGHQFGHYVPQLGDGRSIFIGQVATKKGPLVDVHLKGAGKTPYSRMGDGRAVLRSCIREFLASEAMAALNIPTTRALCITGSTEAVYRETVETGAIMTRLAESHIRFGNFEYWYHQNKMDELNQLADYCLHQHFPECLTMENPHLAMFTDIVKRTATLIAKWQAAGFAHGVMNTDNMSIVGLTIDYGPFGFLDEYNPRFICNHSDHQGRYAFDQQPSIGLWNLNALAVTFSQWLSAEEITTSLKHYEPTLVDKYVDLMREKLGLSHWLDKDKNLLGEYLALLSNDNTDYTLAFRRLNLVKLDDPENNSCKELLQLFKNKKMIVQWLSKYRNRLADNSFSYEKRLACQNASNPLYILRNYLAEKAIKQAEQGNYKEIETLQKVLSTPYSEQPKFKKYADIAPPWSKELEISCSS